MTASVMQGDYCDLRFIKGRKVIQVVLEFPIEAGSQFVSMFGTPDPSKTVPVAIARLDPNAKPERKGGKLAQKAGILCSEGAFITFLAEHHFKKTLETVDPFDPAVVVRNVCGVYSRADLDHDPEAARKFQDLVASFEAWKIAA